MGELLGIRDEEVARDVTLELKGTAGGADPSPRTPSSSLIDSKDEEEQRFDFCVLDQTEADELI